ncbi:hypothetical protein BC830DRAFT_1082940 [Chytriomyces sp. MP71]|nr:hypothetical protein BC830DRAFT_1082940 [Chytriomyces sp. MP71]
MAALGLNDTVPETETEKQAYLTKNLHLGEQFINQGGSSEGFGDKGKKGPDHTTGNVALHTQLIYGCKIGPGYYKLAATCLFRALKVYPDPIKLLMAFQETVPPPVLDLVMQMMASEKPAARKEEKIAELLD